MRGRCVAIRPGMVARYLLGVLLLGGLCGSAGAQTFDFTPPRMVPVLFNPSLVGNVSKQRVDLFFRNQWMNVRSPYNSYGATYDLRFGVYNDHALGVSLFNDVQGSNVLQHTSAMLYYAYKLDVTYDLRLRFGLGVGAMMKSSNYNKLIFPDMLESGPDYVPVVYADKRKFAPDFAVGISGDVNNWYFGVAAHHIAEPRFGSRKTKRGQHDLRIGRKLTMHVSKRINPFELYRFRRPLYIEPQIVVSHEGTFTPTEDNHLRVAAGCAVEYYGVAASVWLRETIFHRSHNITASVGWEGEHFGATYSYTIGFLPQGFRGLNTSVHQLAMRVKIPYPRKAGFSTSTRSKAHLVRYSRKRTAVKHKRRKEQAK